MPLPPTFKQPEGGSQASSKYRHEVHDPQIVKAMTAAYYAKVTMVDDNVGRLLDQLRAQGLAENTLIVFTADHGNMLGDLNRWFKGVMYEGSTRIPLLIKAPAHHALATQFNRGSVVPNIVENIDVMPTLCEMVGVPLPTEGVQGRSLTGLVAGKDRARKETAFAERGSSMIRTADYKLIKTDPKGRQRVGGEYDLYDLRSDPQETQNLAGQPAHAAIVQQLAARLAAWQKDRPPVPVLAGVPLSPKNDDTAAGEKNAEKKKDRKRKRVAQP
jgi:arylsulfatase